MITIKTKFDIGDKVDTDYGFGYVSEIFAEETDYESDEFRIEYLIILEKSNNIMIFKSENLYKVE